LKESWCRVTASRDQRKQSREKHPHLMPVWVPGKSGVAPVLRSVIGLGMLILPFIIVITGLIRSLGVSLLWEVVLIVLGTFVVEAWILMALFLLFSSELDQEEF